MGGVWGKGKRDEDWRYMWVHEEHERAIRNEKQKIKRQFEYEYDAYRENYELDLVERAPGMVQRSTDADATSWSFIVDGVNKTRRLFVLGLGVVKNYEDMLCTKMLKSTTNLVLSQTPKLKLPLSTSIVDRTQHGRVYGGCICWFEKSTRISLYLPMLQTRTRVHVICKTQQGDNSSYAHFFFYWGGPYFFSYCAKKLVFAKKKHNPSNQFFLRFKNTTNHPTINSFQMWTCVEKKCVKQKTMYLLLFFWKFAILGHCETRDWCLWLKPKRRFEFFIFSKWRCYDMAEPDREPPSQAST